MCARAIFLFISAALLAAALLMATGAIVAATARGGILFLAISTCALSIALALRSVAPGSTEEPSRARRVSVWLFMPSAALLAWGAATAPTGAGGDAACRIEHVFLHPGSSFRRFSPANIVPEWDQVRLGIAIMVLVDPCFDAARARRVEALCRARYEALSRDPAYSNFGSALGEAFGELFLGAEPGPNHYVAIAPRKEGVRLREMIVFVHGSAGNFAAYWGALRPLALARDAIVIFPSFGFGNWHRSGGGETIAACVDDACRRFRGDPERVVLVGLSFGCQGFPTAVNTRPGFYRGIALVSGVIDADRIDPAAWAGMPILTLHGAEDERVPAEIMRHHWQTLSDAGARVQSRLYPAEDHFMMFSKAASVEAEILAWLDRMPSPGGAR